MSKTGRRNVALLSVLVLYLSVLLPRMAGAQSGWYKPGGHGTDSEAALRSVPDEFGGFVVRHVGSQAVCDDATPEEGRVLFQRDPDLPLTIISPDRTAGIGPQQTGLTITLRATAQLDANPAAKAAFVRAAANWEALIKSPITIIIDVDFGPMLFGQPFPDSDTLAATNGQRVFNDTIYPGVRALLIDSASSQDELALYAKLPPQQVPTDLGGSAATASPTAPLRAIGLLNPEANPGTETGLGTPPAIGFNSVFSFDFDPANGIDSNKIDFDAVATHEIGHVLGFSTSVGLTEAPIKPTIFDLFRLRPPAGIGTFTTASRALMTGGEQVFFTGTSSLPLSTGGPDGTGGDGNQGSHWKDDALSGTYLGIMDPTIADGMRGTITDNDKLAFDLIGYSFGPAPPGPDPDTVSLSSGVPHAGVIGAPSTPGNGVLGFTQYTIEVPAGATQLFVELSGFQDVDLLMRYGQRIEIQGGMPVSDYTSESFTGYESITVTPNSTPPLRPGTYFIGVGNFGPGTAIFAVAATVTGGASTSPTVTNLAANLVGNVLTLTGTAADADGNIVQAQTSLLNGSGTVINQSAPFNVSFGGSPPANFTLQIPNMSDFPDALRVGLVLIDSQGGRSANAVADFGLADPGGPNIANALFNGAKVVIKGSGFIGTVDVDLNGVLVATVANENNKKIKVKGALMMANLRPGSNRVRVTLGGRRSNLFVFSGQPVQ